MKRNKFIIFSIVVITIFVAINILWYIKTNSLYSPYCKEMEKIETFTYCKYDQEDFGYVVSFPSYLHFNTGCLSITNSKDNSSLIIWPKYGHKSFEYGLILNYEGEEYQINVTKNGKAIDPYEQAVIDANQEIVERLYNKAEKQWLEHSKIEVCHMRFHKILRKL